MTDPANEVVTTITDQVAVITLMAPQRRNAITVEMANSLSAAVTAAESDPAVGAIVITGGPHFCAGAVRNLLAEASEDPAREDNFSNLGAVYQSFYRMGTAAVPTVAAVRGSAVGAGLNLALATDLRIVSTTARLLPGFAQNGIHPGGGHFTLLNRVAGREAAAAMGLFGEEISGARAVELGMAWAAYDDAEVEAAALAAATRVAADPALARRMVQSFRRQSAAGGLQWDVGIEIERSPQMWSLRRTRK